MWWVRVLMVLITYHSSLITISAQDRRPQNKPYIDLRPLHFGISVGFHLQDIEMQNVGPQLITMEDGTQTTETILCEQDNWNPGFSVGVLADQRLSKHFNLRFSPTMHFGAKHLTFHHINRTDNEGRIITATQDMKNTYIAFPISMKFSAERFNNYRPYITGGINPMINLTSKSQDFIQLNVSLNARRVNEEYGNDGSFGTALTINPTFPIYNDDGSFYQPTAPTNATNPVEAMLNKTANGQRLYTTGVASIKANLIKGSVHNFSTTLTYSLDYNDYKSNNYTPIESHDKYWNGYEGTASLSYLKSGRNQLDWLFNYSMHTGEHHLTAVAGYSYQDYNSESMNMTNRGFTYDSILWNDIGAGTARTENPAQTSMGSSKSLSKVIALLARVNYNWNNTVFASASLRHEGATNFGDNNKWGNFPAASIAWELANMDFMSGVNWINSLKPRISFGVTGRRGGSNVARPTYSSHGMYYMDGEWVRGYRPAANENPDLKWEKLVSTNLGVDFVLFNNRLRGSLDLYDRRSPDLLYNYTAPQPPFIHSSILVNVGMTENIGAELSLDGDIIKKKDFGWTSGINASSGYSWIRTLSNQIYGASYIDMLGTGGLGQTSYYYRYTEGSRLGELYGYEAAGVNEYGDMMVYDNDGGIVTAASANAEYKRYIGNTIPKLFLSWNNTFRYKHFDLNIFMNGAFGHMIYNSRRAGNLQSSGNANVFRTAYTRDKDIREYGGVVTSYFLEHGDFMKYYLCTWEV